MIKVHCNKIPLKANKDLDILLELFDCFVFYTALSKGGVTRLGESPFQPSQLFVSHVNGSPSLVRKCRKSWLKGMLKIKIKIKEAWKNRLKLTYCQCHHKVII